MQFTVILTAAILFYRELPSESDTAPKDVKGGLRTVWSPSSLSAIGCCAWIFPTSGPFVICLASMSVWLGLPTMAVWIETKKRAISEGGGWVGAEGTSSEYSIISTQIVGVVKTPILSIGNVFSYYERKRITVIHELGNIIPSISYYSIHPRLNATTQ